MSNAATEMLIGATIDLLRAYPPFDRMESEALRFLAENVKLAYYARETPILAPESGVVAVYRIVQRGRVGVGVADGPQLPAIDAASLTLTAGEGFSIGALLAQRATTSRYVALDDVFCYELAAGHFFALLQQSAVFNRHCTQYLASLLSQSRRQFQSQFAQHVAEQQTMAAPLATLIKRAPLSTGVATTIRAVVEAMAAASVGSMIVVDDEERPVGIFTQSDVLKRVVLTGAGLDAAIASVMSPQPHALPVSASAYDAALAMAMHGVRHVLAVDDGGRLQGVVSERDLFSLQRVGLRQIRQSIDGAANVETLQQAAGDVRQLALNLLAQGVGAEQITQFVSALNDALTRRVIALELERHDLYGIDWAWLSFGSEGRDEQTLATDQDNGIVFVCTDIMDREQTQLRLLDLARDVNADLDRCGFPLCSGGIMAGNAELCLTIDEWDARFEHWIRSPEPQALLNATIFFDFRPLYGQTNLADRLRLSLLRRARGNPLFLRLLAGNALDVAPPLGTFRDFVTDADSAHPGTIDLKKYGARLFIDATRIFALANEVAATNTVQRLRQVAPLMGIAADETAAVVDAFNFIQLMRLRHQHAAQTQGKAPDNLIRPDELNEVERRILKEAFRQARKLQQRLKLDYQL